MTLELLFILFCGLCFGSFVTCASYRLPLNQDVVRQPSYCPKCEAKLGFKDLWPVASWVSSGGKCRHCAAKIHWRYPAIELITAGVFALIYLRYGFTVHTLLLSLFAVALLVMIVADFEHYIIPDEVHWVLVPLGAAYHFAIGTPPEDVVYGLLLGGGLGLSLLYGYRHLRKKEGLGWGDVKFFAVAGLWLGVFAFVPFLFYSGLFGVVTGLVWKKAGRGAIFPFGPSLAMALFVCTAYPESVKWFWDIGKYLQ